MEPTSDWLSNLKIRASYGTTGNDMDLSKDPIDKVDAFSYLQKYQLGEKYIFGNNLANTIVAGATPNYALHGQPQLLIMVVWILVSSIIVCLERSMPFIGKR